MFKHFYKNSAGFTLIEILVAMTIFTIVITAFLGLFGSAMEHQRKNLNKITLLNSLSYASEYVTRALRMALKDIDGDCITARMNFEDPVGGGVSIQFLNYDKKCWRFSLNAGVGVIEVLRSPDSTSGSLPVGNPEMLTPEINFNVTNLRFNVSGDGQDNSPESELQPAVTFVLGAEVGSGAELAELNIQTTISQRELDIRY